MSRKFRHWVDAYQNEAWTLARYLLKDAQEAEDVTQESFVKLWRHADEIDPEKIKPWLMKVVRNGCFDQLRRRRPTEEVAERHLTDKGEGAVEGAEQMELGSWLIRAINGLGEPYRSLVVLRDVQQHSYAEVAGATELNLSQVKVYLHRARKRLREQLAEVRP